MPRRKRFLLVCLSLFYFCLLLHAEVEITGLKVVPVNDLSRGIKAKAEVTFNRALKISDILLMQAGKQQGLKFPVYISEQGEEYPQIVVLKRKNYEEIITAIRTEKPLTPNGKEELTYRISQFSLAKKLHKIKVFAAVVFDDSLQISCKIIQAKNGRLWVAWPAQEREQKRWFKQVIFLDKNLEKSIEKALLHKYRLLGE